MAVDYICSTRATSPTPYGPDHSMKVILSSITFMPFALKSSNFPDPDLAYYSSDKQIYDNKKIYEIITWIPEWFYNHTISFKKSLAFKLNIDYNNCLLNFGHSLNDGNNR